MIFDVFILDSDNMADIDNIECDSLRFNDLNAEEAKLLCNLARKQNYTVCAYLRVEE